MWADGIRFMHRPLTDILQVETVVNTVVYCSLPAYERKPYLPCEVRVKECHNEWQSWNWEESTVLLFLRFWRNNIIWSHFKDQYVVLMQNGMQNYCKSMPQISGKYKTLRNERQGTTSVCIKVCAVFPFF